jgi:hypothetical protein
MQWLAVCGYRACYEADLHSVDVAVCKVGMPEDSDSLEGYEGYATLPGFASIRRARMLRNNT